MLSLCCAAASIPPWQISYSATSRVMLCYVYVSKSNWLVAEMLWMLIARQISLNKFAWSAPAQV